MFLVGTAPYVIAANAERPYKTFADVDRGLQGKPRRGEIRLRRHRHAWPSRDDGARQEGRRRDHACALPRRRPGHERRARRPCRSDRGIGGADHGATGHQHAASRSCKWGASGCPSLKDTQTAIEAGFPDFETLAWWGVFAPKDTPPDIIASMAKSVKRNPERAGGGVATARDAADDAAARRRKEFSTFFAKQVSDLGPGRAREQHQGVGTPAAGNHNHGPPPPPL